MDTDITPKLESLLLRAQLLIPKSSNSSDSVEFKEVYEEICRLVLNQQAVDSLWHEPVRKLPRQGDSIKGELPAVCRALNRDGGTRPKASWGRSSLYSCIHSALISRT